MAEKESNPEPEEHNNASEDKDDIIEQDDTELEGPEIKPGSILEILRKGRELIKPIHDKIKQLKKEFKELSLKYGNAPDSELEEINEAMKNNIEERQRLTQERENIEEETKQKIRNRSKEKKQGDKGDK